MAIVNDAEDTARALGEALADEPRLLAKALMAFTADPRHLAPLAAFFEDELAPAVYIARGAGIRDFARQPGTFGPERPA